MRWVTATPPPTAKWWLIQLTHTAITAPLGQYLLGTLINLIYLVIVISNQTSYQNIQVPENNYAGNLWQGTDVLGYVRPAQNFVEHRIFGYGRIPDYHRTIGYPLFLSGSIMVFGNYWLNITLFMQALIFASIYPVLSRISRILFNASDRAVTIAFLFLILSGTYIVMVPMILTDTFFTVFFMLGLWLGLESIVHKRYMFLFFHIIFVGYAAQVRPLLSIYPFINCLLMLSITIKYDLFRHVGTYKMIVISFTCLIIICNLPSIRNYQNHNFPRPTDTLSNDMFNQLAKYVSIAVNRSEEYDESAKLVERVDGLNQRTKLQEQFALNIYKDHPLVTLKQMTHNAIGILGRAHWPVVAHFWGYSFLNSSSPGLMPLRKSTGVYLLEIFFNFVYLIVYLSFLMFLVRLFRSGNIMLSLTLVIFMTYLLIPGFIGRGAGSRYRLPVEGLIVLMAACEFESFLNAFKHNFYKIINSIYASLGLLIPFMVLKADAQQDAQEFEDRQGLDVWCGLNRLVMARPLGWLAPNRRGV